MKAADRLRARHVRDLFRGLRHAFKAAARIHAAGPLGELTMMLWLAYHAGIASQARLSVEIWRRYHPQP